MKKTISPLIIKVEKIKKKIVAPTPVVAPPVEVKSPVNVDKSRPIIITFYGHDIRNTFMNNQWFFSLEDILKIVEVVNPTKFLIDLKNHEALKDRYYQLVETFSYYEGDSPIIIPVTNYQNFIEILPHLRQMNLSFPGPFPDWLKQVANRKF
ncbi:MAG: hypothetical protein WC069_04695 [Candidatus Shapirobacteria bacterium]